MDEKKKEEQKEELKDCKGGCGAKVRYGGYCRDCYYEFHESRSELGD